MQKFIIIFLAQLLMSTNMLAQHYQTDNNLHEIVEVSGVITDAQLGDPLIAVTVVVKGTTTGVLSDIDGKYSIKAKVGDILTFSYIGFNTQEVKVTTNKKINIELRDDFYGGDGGYYVYLYYKNPYIKEPVAPKRQPDMSALIFGAEPKGIGVMTDRSARIRNVGGEISEIKSISKPSFDSLYHIDYQNNEVVLTGVDLTFASSTGFEEIMVLPKLQNTYSQGYGNQWHGSDEGTIFSWGANMKDLGSEGYDATSFFRTGMRTTNNLSLKVPATNEAYIDFGLRQKKHESVLRGSNNETYIMSLAIKELSFDDLSIGISTSYNYSKGRLLSHGANQASIIGAIYSTPVSFDNSNGQHPQKVNNSPWLLPDGSLRSYSPGIMDNPFGLENQSPDKDMLQEASINIDLSYSKRKWKFGMSARSDVKDDDRIIGNTQGYRGSDNINYYRNQMQQGTDVNIFGSWHSYRNLTLHSRLGYNNSYAKLKTNHNASNFSEINFYSGNRNSYEFQYEGDYYINKVKTKVRLSNRHYFSNTANNYTNLFPLLGLEMDIDRFWRYYYNHKLKRLTIRGTISRSIREAPMVSGNEIPFTGLSVGQYQKYFPTANLLFNSSLKPEIIENKTFGLSTMISNFSMDVEYLNTYTRDFISHKDNKLANVGGVKTDAWKLAAYCYTRIGYEVKLDLHIKWYKYTSIVQGLNSGNDYLPIAGFNEVQTAFAAGKPLGAIYGSDYKRNGVGKAIIDADGYPIKDNSLRMIGDPTPDWMMNFNPKVTYKNFDLLLGFEWKKGGDMWNGTQAYLDYLGRSKTTGDLRNTIGYVFDGVTQAGAINTTPVNFLSNNFYTNRWTRYGMDGVGKEYIEDASWLRMSEIGLYYNFNLDSDYFKKIQLGLTVRNVFLITKYKGVDPSSSLFNYPAANGLDLFNSPGVRSYMFTIRMDISNEH